MRLYDLYLRFNQKQIKTIISISVYNINYLILSKIEESNRFNEFQNIESTVYYIWGGVALHYPLIRPPPMFLL